ncbi:MAG TPA: prephenate dehydrogenase/arogenate dehydrogenase family protein [Candidatus Limnocylindrales bacterium]|nr:prephenate dehydrogenase/arogenate dehydrogenase family protein [Candidatus Limnocylindrales bacterium]
MRVAFIGFGLIAGSIARALRSNPETNGWQLAAWSPSGDGPRRALAEGVIDLAAPSLESVLPGADLVVLAGPATACFADLDGLAGPWRGLLSADAVITDVASTKGMLVDHADALGLRFVGGHPMAGRETAGYAAADAGLFADRPWVLVPGVGASGSDVALVARLASACGARIVQTDALTHDRAVAAISHLPLVLAAALVEAVAGRADWSEAATLAAGAWRDMTRVARGDEAMGAAILATNAPAVATRLRDLRGALDAWLAELERPDGPDERAITDRLHAARSILDQSG